MIRRPGYLRRPLALVLVALLALAACSSAERPSLDASETTTEAADQAAAAGPTEVDPDANLVAESIIRPEQVIHESPDGPEKTTLPNPWVGDSPLVFLVKEDLGDWLEVYLPIRPNGSTGFVPRSDVEVSQHPWRIEVRLSEFELTVYEGDEVFLETSIAVARDNTPTPGGLYYTTELLQPTDDQGNIDPDGIYGHYAYGLSGYSETLQSFSGGPGQLGIHGTNQPELIGQKVSHGCIRMRNEDIDRLASVLPLGVPVEVVP